MTVRSPLLPLLFLASVVPASARADAPKPAPGVAATLSIEGVAAGAIGDFEVPRADSDVMLVPQADGVPAKKHIGMLRYAATDFTIGANAATAMTDWIAATLQLQHLRKNFAVTSGATRHDFFNAVISRIVFPALGASSPGPAWAAVEVTPEYARSAQLRRDPSRDDAASVPALAGLSSRLFGVALDGLDTKTIVRVDPFSVTISIAEDRIGVSRDYVKEPGTVVFSDLSLYLRPADAASFVAWHQDFVVLGNCGDDKEKSGRVEYYTEGGKLAFTVHLSGVGISAIREFVIGDVPVLKVDLYVERMEFVRARDLEGAGAPAPKKQGTRAAGPPRKAAAATPLRRVIGKRRPIPGRKPSGKIPPT